MGKGKQWLIAEDVALAEAWVHVAEQDTTGQDDRFWGAVHENWVARLGGSLRSEQALKNHWAFVQRATRKFVNYVHAAAAIAGATSNANTSIADVASGSTSTDVIERAMQMYHDGEGEAFALMSVYNVLKTSPKWLSSKTPASSFKRSRTSIGGDDAANAKALKRQSLPTGIGNGQLQAPAVAAPPPGTTVTVAAPPARVAVVRPAAAPRRSPVRSPPRVASSAIRTSPHAATVASSPVSTESITSQRDFDDDDADATQVVQTLVLDAAPLRSTYASLPAATAAAGAVDEQTTRESHAASIAALAAAQRERNDLAADQMLLTMLLQDPVNASNRLALERLQRKYLRRAFPSSAASLM